MTFLDVLLEFLFQECKEIATFTFYQFIWMLCFHVICNSTSLLSTVNTVVAGMWSFISMCEDVIVKMTSIISPILTSRTGVWVSFLCFMNYFMSHDTQEITGDDLGE